MTTRENFDFVSMDTYKADMDDLGQQGAGIIERLVREKKELERTIWLLVNAAGGRVNIYDGDVIKYDPRHCKLAVTIYEYDHMTEFRARSLVKAPS